MPAELPCTLTDQPVDAFRIACPIVAQGPPNIMPEAWKRPQHTLSTPTLGSASTYTVVPVKEVHDWQSPSEKASPAGHTQRPFVHVPADEAPHAAPTLFGSAPPLTHCCDPVAHEYVPSEHGSTLWDVHEPPAVQSTHWPPLQTMSMPHDVPFAWAVALLTQLGAPAAMQLIVPSWQEPALGLQLAPFVHGVHVPP